MKDRQTARDFIKPNCSMPGSCVINFSSLVRNEPAAASQTGRSSDRARAFSSLKTGASAETRADPLPARPQHALSVPSKWERALNLLHCSGIKLRHYQFQFPRQGASAETFALAALQKCAVIISVPSKRERALKHAAATRRGRFKWISVP